MFSWEKGILDRIEVLKVKQQGKGLTTFEKNTLDDLEEVWLSYNNIMMDLVNSENKLEQFMGTSLLVVRTYAWHMDTLFKEFPRSASTGQLSTTLTNSLKSGIIYDGRKPSIFNALTRNGDFDYIDNNDIYLSDFFNLILDPSIQSKAPVRNVNGITFLNFPGLMLKVRQMLEPDDDGNIALKFFIGSDANRIGSKIKDSVAVKKTSNTDENILIDVWSKLYSVLVFRKAWEKNKFYQAYLDIVESLFMV